MPSKKPAPERGSLDSCPVCLALRKDVNVNEGVISRVTENRAKNQESRIRHGRRIDEWMDGISGAVGYAEAIDDVGKVHAGFRVLVDATHGASVRSAGEGECGIPGKHTNDGGGGGRRRKGGNSMGRGREGTPGGGL